jgi:hypothetical protein
VIAATHFVGFRGPEYFSARAVFGAPDFIHREWDARAEGMTFPGDRVVFANRADQKARSIYSIDDSQFF